MVAKYPIVDVKALVEEYKQERLSAIYFSAPTRSIKSVARVFSRKEAKAEEIVLQGLLSLEEQFFVESFVQWGIVVDLFALEGYLGHNWYVKLAIIEGDEGRDLEEISFHPLEVPVTISDGRTVEVTYTSF